MTDDRSETRRRLPWGEENQVDAAAYAAGAIGGGAGDEDVDPVERPLQEADEAKRRASSSRRRTYRGGGGWPEVGRPVRTAFPPNPRTDPDRLTASVTTSFPSALPDDDT